MTANSAVGQIVTGACYSKEHLKKHKHDCMASAEREPIIRVWGEASSEVQGQIPWLGNQGAKPHEADTDSFLAFTQPNEWLRTDNIYRLEEPIM